MWRFVEKYSPVLLIFAAAAFRLLPHMPNFAPIGAIALFGGAYLPKKYALVVPVLIMFISDIFLGFHSTIIWVYGSFILIGLLGILIRNKTGLGNIFLASVLSSVAFFIITNFGVWLSSGMYPNTAEGLVQCFTMAIPFFRNTILGDLFYNGILFGSFVLIKRIIATYNIARS